MFVDVGVGVVGAGVRTGSGDWGEDILFWSRYRRRRHESCSSFMSSSLKLLLLKRMVEGMKRGGEWGRVVV